MVVPRSLLVAAMCVGLVTSVCASTPGSSPPGSNPSGRDCGTEGRQQVYDRHCANCHGTTMEGGRGPALVGASFWERWGSQPTAKLASKIRMTMPADDPGSLDSSQVTKLVNLILTSNGQRAACAVSAMPNSPRSEASNERTGASAIQR